jgi:uncharacterized protein YbjT (DUF2867 family)
MDSARPVLVTGALGNIGQQVVAELRGAGRAVRAADLDPEAVHQRMSGVEAVRFDFTDPTSWGAAFDGVEVMFLMRPPHLSRVERDMVPALEQARSSGVRHVVLLSLQGADRNRAVPHARLEQWLRGSGQSWTFIRPSFFMENLSTIHAADIRDHDVILVPAGRGRTSFVAAADVAAVAAAALLDPQGHANRAWTPTGPEALTYDEVAGILSAVLDRSIRYVRPGAARYLRHATHDLGMPRPMALVTTAIYTVARMGRAGGLTDDVVAVTGRQPLPLRDWARAHRQVWQRSG